MAVATEAPIPSLVTLKARAEFLAVRGGRRASTPAFLLEARQRGEGQRAGGPRFGFTVTKKLGNAVKRNRIRRRLKAVIADHAGLHARDGFDYVIVARSAAFDRPFEALVGDVQRALIAVHATAAQPRPRRNAAAADKKPTT